ncbi:hypothetical protein [Methylovirgula sp. HY1]|nr:hypothetical protein [Methylovirgula sp. HY1]
MISILEVRPSAIRGEAVLDALDSGDQDLHAILALVVLKISIIAKRVE